MKFDKVKTAIMRDENKRAKRKDWSSQQWLCYANGYNGIKTADIWNQHTREQSVDYNGAMNLKPYFIVAIENEIFYGLDSLSEKDKRATDWEVI